MRMPYININIPAEQLSKLDSIRKKLNKNRSVYIREAINYYIVKTEREFLAEQFNIASKKCRDESISVCNEFENIDLISE